MRHTPNIMSSAPITEGFFVIAAVIAASMLTATILPGVMHLSNSYSAQAANLQQKTDLQLTVVLAYGTSNTTSATVWVKNTGIVPLSKPLIDKSDLFFGPVGQYYTLKYGGAAPSWNYSIVNDLNGNGILDPGETMQITVTTASPLSPGDYYFQITTYLGTSFDYTFSI